MKKLLLSIATLLTTVSAVNAQAVTENFDDFSAAITAGWTVSNLSNPLGVDIWGQGNPGTFGSAAFNGADSSFAQIGYLATTGTATGTISAWLISPTIPLANGLEVSFYTLSFNSATYADRLECRMNILNNTNVGTTETSVGDFTTLLISVNPNLDNTSYPSIQVGNQTWTKFTTTISGLTTPVAGRIAFRYFVTDGGGNGSNSSSIGLDEVRVGSSTASVEELENTLTVSPNPTTDVLNVVSNKEVSLVVYDVMGKEVISLGTSNGTTKVDVSNLENGTYILVDSISGSRTKFVKK